MVNIPINDDRKNPGQNPTGQNPTLTKPHRTKPHTDMLGPLCYKLITIVNCYLELVYPVLFTDPKA